MCKKGSTSVHSKTQQLITKANMSMQKKRKVRLSSAPETQLLFTMGSFILSFPGGVGSKGGHQANSVTPITYIISSIFHNTTTGQISIYPQLCLVSPLQTNHNPTELHSARTSMTPHKTSHCKQLCLQQCAKLLLNSSKTPITCYYITSNYKTKTTSFKSQSK